MRFVKPLDEDLVLSLAARHRAIVTIEENAVAGGAGSAVAELLASEGVSMPLLQLGIPDRFIEHGSARDCLAAAGPGCAGPQQQHRALVGPADPGTRPVNRALSGPLGRHRLTNGERRGATGRITGCYCIMSVRPYYHWRYSCRLQA